MDFRHDEHQHRYLGSIDGIIVTSLDYADNGSVVAMTRTFTNPTFRGKGYAAEIVAYAVDAAEAAGRSVRPSCWYVADWFEAHPERRGLLA